MFELVDCIEGYLWIKNVLFRLQDLPTQREIDLATLGGYACGETKTPGYLRELLYGIKEVAHENG